MPALSVFPQRLDRATAPEQLDAGAVRQLQRVEIVKQPGVAAPARGQTRASGFAGETSSVLGCAVLERADGVKQLIWCVGGAVKVQVGITPAYADADYGL